MAKQVDVIECPECNGQGWYMGYRCCGNLGYRAQCHGACAIPIQVECEDCHGSGKQDRCPDCEITWPSNSLTVCLCDARESVKDVC